MIKISLWKTALLPILLSLSCLVFTTNSFAAQWMEGAKLYNARFCEPEEAFADQAHAMRGLDGFTNITNEEVTVTCPVIRMKYYAPRVEIMIFRKESAPFLNEHPRSNPNDYIRCTFYEISGRDGTVVSSHSDQQWMHNFMTGIYANTTSGFFTHYGMQCTLPAGVKLFGYSVEEL